MQAKRTAKRIHLSIGAVSSLLCACVLLAACASSPPKPAKVRMSVVATSDVNPAADGRPSPIVLRIYQLKDDAKFTNADFFALYDMEQQALGGDLLSREEIVLNPNEKREPEFAVAADAKFVGVLAAYRDIRNARWRTVQASPKKGLMNLVKKDAVAITAGRDGVELKISE